jgi:hypothetical protein
MPTHEKKSYKHFMLSSQHRNTNGSKLHSCKHANTFASVVEAVPSLAAQSGVVNHEFIFMPSPSSRSMAKPTGSMVAIALF